MNIVEEKYHKRNEKVEVILYKLATFNLLTKYFQIKYKVQNK